MSCRRGSLAVCTISDTSLLAVGGYDGTKNVAACEILDMRAGRWRPAASMSAGRAFGSAVTLDSGDQVVA